jgi:hypothetical protein
LFCKIAVSIARVLSSKSRACQHFIQNYKLKRRFLVAESIHLPVRPERV